MQGIPPAGVDWRWDTLPTTMLIDSFLARWSASGDAERANKDSFLNELCDVLGVERPHPPALLPRVISWQSSGKRPLMTSRGGSRAFR